MWDVSRPRDSRVSEPRRRETRPVWWPDDRWIVFSSNRDGGGLQIWRQASDGTGEPELRSWSGIRSDRDP